MKSIFLTLAIFLAANSFSQKEPIVMTIDGEGVTKSEFLQIYLKNNPNPKYDKVSLDEYMDLFQKFKIKSAPTR